MGQAKLTRALMRGGVAERSADGAYRVWRSANRRRRPLGVLARGRGDGLRADGKLALIAGETALYAWAGEVSAPSTTDLPRPVQLSPARKRRPARALLVRALDTAPDDRERARLADAIKRFLSDAECASSGGRITMNWQSLATGRRGGLPAATDHLPGYARARAAARLGQVAAYVGEANFQLLSWVIAEEMSAAELARRLGLRPAATPEYTAERLRELAAAYDQHVSAR